MLLSLAVSGLTESATATTYPALNGANFPSGVYTEGYPATYPVPLPYRYFVPVGYSAANTSRKYPLVIFLHGNGELGVYTSSNNTAQLYGNANGAMIFISSANPNNQADNPCFWVAPQSYSETTRSTSQLEGLIRYFLNTYPIDPDRIYITGLSGGGAFTWDMLAAYPNRFAAASPICGWGQGTEAVHKNVSNWVFVCADDNVVPPAGSESAVSRLRAAGGDPIFTRYLTGRHAGSWTYAYDASTPLVAWMMAQQRGLTNQGTVFQLTTTAPTTLPNYVSNTTPVAFAGTASDGVTAVNWTNLSTAATSSATGSASWTAGAIPLQPGNNSVRFLATGAAYGSIGNGTTTYSITKNIYASPSTDTAPPTIAITSPSSGSSHTALSSLVTLSGTASDNLLVTKVLWSNDRGGSGAAIGTTAWTAPGMDLQLGPNIITVTAQDVGGNSASATLTVNFGALPTNQPPTVYAGADQSIILPAAADLLGSLTDDGLTPGSPSPTATWSKVSGPGIVFFANPNAVSSTAEFSAFGTYVLRLSGSDGVLSAEDHITVAVSPAGSSAYTLKYDFGNANITSGNWNNVTNAGTGLKISNSIGTDGTSRGISLTITTTFSGVNTAGSTSQAGAYPASAMQDSFHVQNNDVAASSLGGLSATSTYNFTFFASRLSDGSNTNRLTAYTIGSSTVTLDATDNISGIATIVGVAPDSTGTILLHVANFTGAGFGYLGVLEVRAVTPGAFDAWRITQFGPDAADPEIGGATADPDRDGASNAMEYALGGNPYDPNSNMLPTSGYDANRLEIRFVRSVGADVIYIVQNSQDLVEWHPIATLSVNAVWTGPATVEEAGAGATRSVLARDSAVGWNEGFLRLKVVVSE